ncbi:hypothetical protein BH10BAC3_BH10BAC3_23610 [soil metagenome]
MRKRLLIIITSGCVAISATGQNVGISTSTPTRAKLELNGMVGNTTAIFGTGGNGIGLGADAPSLQFNAYFNQGTKYIGDGYAIVQYLDPGNGTFRIQGATSGVKDALVTGIRPAITIASNGRVSIGDDHGLGFNAQLSVGKDADKDATAWFSAPQWSAFNYTSAEHTYIRAGANSTKLFMNYYAQNSKIVMGGGTSNVGINWSLPVYPLEIHANDFGIGLMRMGSLNHWLIIINFNYLKLLFRSTTAENAFSQLGVFDYSTGKYSSLSDRRMKKQIEPLPPMLEKLMQLKAYRYEMKYNNPAHDETIGLIAQEVKEIFPSLVHVIQNANTGYKDISDVHTLAYSGLAPFVIKALQEQNDMLDKLMERVATLEDRK